MNRGLPDRGPEIIIFQHVPKCGGQSFRAAWKAMGFEIIIEKPPARSDAEAWQRYLDSPVDIPSLAGDTFISGHFIYPGIRPTDRYADAMAAGKARVVTLVRDPFERVVSDFYFAKSKGRSLAPRVEDRLAVSTNQITRVLDCARVPPSAAIERFLVVGLCEHLQKSVDVACRLLGRERVVVPRKNVTQIAKDPIADEVRQEFIARNHLDYAFVEEAERVLLQRHHELCPDWADS